MINYDNVRRTEEAFDESGTADAARTGQTDERVDFCEVEVMPKPVLADAALYGLLGDITQFITPQTEADPMAIYSQFLVAYGNSIGRKAFFQVEQSRHYTNLFLVLVGVTAKGRKGVALDYVRAFYRQADPFYLPQMVAGLSSGEGLIWAVRDPVPGNGKEVDQGVIDKRLLVTETEFARPLKVMTGPTNILSTVLRAAWDSGNLGTIVKNNPNRATDAHISVIGHITMDELKKEMPECDLLNGFANRFLWPIVERTQLLPEGGQLDPEILGKFVAKFQQSLVKARVVGEMTRSDEAREHWHSIYAELSVVKHAGTLGAVISRAEPMVMRISMILALSDGSPVITLKHQLAAVAIWEYCYESACRLFKSKLTDPNAQKILEALQNRPEGMTRCQISEVVFSRNLRKLEIKSALRLLLQHKLAFWKSESTNGRDAEHWFATTLIS